MARTNAVVHRVVPHRRTAEVSHGVILSAAHMDGLDDDLLPGCNVSAAEEVVWLT